MVLKQEKMLHLLETIFSFRLSDYDVRRIDSNSVCVYVCFSANEERHPMQWCGSLLLFLVNSGSL